MQKLVRFLQNVLEESTVECIELKTIFFSLIRGEQPINLDCLINLDQLLAGATLEANASCHLTVRTV
jgi:hypothetical protein